MEASIATRTQITIVKPDGGNGTVPVGRAVTIAVHVQGKVPDPSRPNVLRLQYRYNPADPYEERLLERGESSQDWFTTVAAVQVQNGFYYRVSGGDTETAEYRIQVRSTPLLTGFEVSYRYPAYTRFQDASVRDPNLIGPGGTDVTPLARTNRHVREGQLTIPQEKPIQADLIPGEPEAFLSSN